MNSLESLAQAIKQNNSFLIIAHVNMDGDALGSSGRACACPSKYGQAMLF